MTPWKIFSPSSTSNSQPQQAAVVAGKTCNGTRSASAAFGDDSDVESPARKKQNTAASISVPKTSGDIARTSMNNGVQSPVNGVSRNLEVDRIDGVVGMKNGSSPICSYEEKKEGILDIVPPTSTASTKPAKVARTSRTLGPDKTAGVATKVARPQNGNCDNAESQIVDVPKPQNGNCGNTESQIVNDSSADKAIVQNGNRQNAHVRSWSVDLGWFGIFIFMNLILFSAIIWSSLLLNESVTYQLESLECRERLQQVYHEMGLTLDLEDTNDMNGEKIANANEQQKIYWKELEDQVQYWKKEAKRHQQNGEGFRDQCEKDLQHLLEKVTP